MNIIESFEIRALFDNAKKHTRTCDLNKNEYWHSHLNHNILKGLTTGYVSTALMHLACCVNAERCMRFIPPPLSLTKLVQG